MQEVQPEIFNFTKAKNNPELPVLLYRGAMADERERVRAFEEHYKKNKWKGTWEDTIYTFQHFHSNAHEALGIAEGEVSLELGGVHGKILDLIAGDLIVLPAGTIHKRLSKGKVVVVGAYPEGQENYNMYKDTSFKFHQREVKGVPLPEFDPLYGLSGPLQKLWSVARA